jgi:hypothetical protein
VCPSLLSINEKSVVEHALIGMLIVLNLYRAEFEVAVREISTFTV